MLKPGCNLVGVVVATFVPFLDHETKFSQMPSWFVVVNTCGFNMVALVWTYDLFACCCLGKRKVSCGQHSQE